MTERGRNRLVGAVILIALAVILLPMLFDGAGVERRSMNGWPETERAPDQAEPDLESEIDPADWAFAEAVQQRREAEPVRGQPEHREVVLPPEAVAATTDDAVDGDALESPELDERGLPRAFSVQLAAFRDLDNARTLRQRLLDDGYDAYLIEEGEGVTTLHRVAVGPRIDRAAALRLKDELAERYELEGLLVRFTIATGAAQQDG